MLRHEPVMHRHLVARPEETIHSGDDQPDDGPDRAADYGDKPSLHPRSVLAHSDRPWQGQPCADALAKGEPTLNRLKIITAAIAGAARRVYHPRLDRDRLTADGNATSGAACSREAPQPV